MFSQQIYAQKTSGRWRRFMLAGLAGVVLLIGSCGMSARSLAAGETRRSGGTEGHFLSGGERSEIVLKRILATLERMDARLARMEKLLSAHAANAAAAGH